MLGRKICQSWQKTFVHRFSATVVAVLFKTCELLSWHSIDSCGCAGQSSDQSEAPHSISSFVPSNISVATVLLMARIILLLPPQVLVKYQTEPASRRQAGFHQEQNPLRPHTACSDRCLYRAIHSSIRCFSRNAGSLMHFTLEEASPGLRAGSRKEVLFS